MSKIRVLIVDDSPTMRGVISAVLGRDPQIEVVGTASDPYEARERIKTLLPDVVTLDVEMPRMNGVDFLEKLMRLRPTPTIMVSTLTHQGAEMSVEALRLGAFDCVGKPTSGDPTQALSVLPEKVRAASKSRIAHRRSGVSTPPPDQYTPSDKVVFIGASTGGVDALLTVLGSFPENCPPTLVTQHMMAGFIENFASRLDRACAAKVEVATEGALVRPGRVYIAPGGHAHLEIRRSGGLVCRIRPGEPISGHRPSVDAMFESAAEVCGARAVGAILTGMGSDGAKGLLAMREAGAVTFGQNESTCVVYGMPRVAKELGAVVHEAPLSKIAERVLSEGAGIARASA